MTDVDVQGIGGLSWLFIAVAVLVLWIFFFAGWWAAWFWCW